MQVTAPQAGIRSLYVKVTGSLLVAKYVEYFNRQSYYVSVDLGNLRSSYV
jgi:hypothetical protein